MNIYHQQCGSRPFWPDPTQSLLRPFIFHSHKVSLAKFSANIFLVFMFGKIVESGSGQNAPDLQHCLKPLYPRPNRAQFFDIWSCQGVMEKFLKKPRLSLLPAYPQLKRESSNVYSNNVWGGLGSLLKHYLKFKIGERLTNTFPLGSERDQ